MRSQRWRSGGSGAPPGGSGYLLWVVDDELRRRIAAKVAARRAASASAASDPPAERASAGDDAAPDARAESLQPVRPWERDAADRPRPPAPAAQSERTGLTPVRPWERAATAATGTEREGSAVRPGAPAGRAPSNPSVVLTDLAGGSQAGDDDRRRRFAQLRAAVSAHPGGDGGDGAEGTPAAAPAAAASAPAEAADDAIGAPEAPAAGGPASTSSRGGRALRWLFARSPEPTPEPMPQPTPEPMPQPTPEPMPQPTPEPIPQPTPGEVAPPASGTRKSRWTRRRASSDDLDEGGPAFPLPEADPQLDTPWSHATHTASAGEVADAPAAAQPETRHPMPAASQSRPRPGPGQATRPAVRPTAVGAAAQAARPRAPRSPRPGPGAGGSAKDSSEPAPTARTDAPSASVATRPGTDRVADAPSSPAKTATPAGKWKLGPAAGRLLRIAVVVVIAAAAALVLRTYVVSPYYVPSQSMEPTLRGCPHCDDDRILVDKISYRLHAPHRTDIVVFHAPPSLRKSDPVLVKRVIGLPGERLTLRGGRVLIDGRPLAEPYVRHGCRTTPETSRSSWTVPSGDVFVMGDNRCNSDDSRDFGPIPESSIIGRAFVIVWPLSRLRWL